MTKMQTFHSKESVKARKVTEKDGEDVVTYGGPVHVEKGDYVVEAGDSLKVVEAEEFESRYKAGGTTAAKKSTTRRRTPKKSSAAPSPADRVKAAQKSTQKRS